MLSNLGTEGGSVIVAAVSAVIALVSVIFAVIARGDAKRSANAAEASVVEAKRLADIETERRAEEVARNNAHRLAGTRAELSVTKQGDRIFVTNHGPSSAMNVVVQCTDVHGFGAIDSMKLRAGDSDFTHDTITLGVANPVPYVISWSDGDGHHSEERGLRL